MCGSCFWSCFWSRCSTLDVWCAMVFIFFTSPARRRAASQRICGRVWIDVGNLGLFAPARRSDAFRGCQLHRRGLLVYGVDLVRESRGDNCPLLIGYVCPYS